MYDYRKMTPEQKAAVLAERRARGFPLHAPPHFEEGVNTYLLTATCYEHKSILNTPNRLEEFSSALLDGVQKDASATLHAWVVLPNHYHLLADVDLAIFRKWIGRLHNGKSTQWNREDNTLGRKVWYHFVDRKIRNDRHFHASINYVHNNPVKHGYVAKLSEWVWSSLLAYLENFGPEMLSDWWDEYPVKDFGKGWDD